MHPMIEPNTKVV